MPWIILAIGVSYLAGSIPTAYFFAKTLKGIDIRKHGSGNVGATNALRVLGKKIGLTVLLLDMLKGALPVIFLGDYLAAKNIGTSSELIRVLIGISCICGHNWTVFLRFKGGKGVATTFGVLFGLGLRVAGLGLVLGLVILTWLIVFLLLRIVSIASIISVMALPIYISLFSASKVLIASGLLLAIFIIFRHRSNLTRFFQGKEPRLSFKK